MGEVFPDSKLDSIILSSHIYGPNVSLGVYVK
jgi:hypothetical protein